LLEREERNPALRVSAYSTHLTHGGGVFPDVASHLLLPDPKTYGQARCGAFRKRITSTRKNLQSALVMLWLYTLRGADSVMTLTPFCSGGIRDQASAKPSLKGALPHPKPQHQVFFQEPVHNLSL